MRTASLLALAWAMGLGCQSESRGATGATTLPASRPAIETFGTVHEVAGQGATEPRVALRSLLPGPHLFGVGALSELRGEITILDDVVWLSYPGASDGEPVRIERATADTDERATLLVASRVAEWQAIAIEREIEADELEERVAELARASGVSTEEAFPFRIEGTFSEARWHVMDGRRLTPGGGHESHARAALRSEARARRGVAVGFYSRHHQGVFTHHGQRTHVHVSFGPGGMGHVERLGVAAGATLHLPRVR